jgi:TIR domain
MVWMTRLSQLNPWKHKRDERLRQYLETEEHEVMDAILRSRAERDEKERQIDLELFREGREGSNRLINREMRMLPLTLDYQRTIIAARLQIRKRLALECPELLSDAQLSTLEEAMLGSVEVARQARRDDCQRRAAAAGVPVLRPEERDAAEYGELEAQIRREIRQLSLARSLGRLGAKKQLGIKAVAMQRFGILETLEPSLKQFEAVPAIVSGTTAHEDSSRPRMLSSNDIATHSFSVAFSFRGEARHRIGQIANILEKELGPGEVFYDEWYKPELARPNLDLLLQRLYTRAVLVVVCLCADFERKEWCGLEWRAIRDLIKKRQDKVMFLRLDDADVAGAFSLDGYLDLRTHDDTDVASLIHQRVMGNPRIVTPPSAEFPDGSAGEPDQVGKPRSPELSAMEEARRKHVARLLEKSDPEELRVLVHLATHGRTDVSTINAMCSNTVPINNLLLNNLVKHIPAPPGAPSFQQFYEINHQLLDAVVFDLNVRGLVGNR